MLVTAHACLQEEGCQYSGMRICLQKPQQQLLRSRQEITCSPVLTGTLLGISVSVLLDVFPTRILSFQATLGM